MTGHTEFSIIPTETLKKNNARLVFSNPSCSHSCLSENSTTEFPSSRSEISLTLPNNSTKSISEVIENSTHEDFKGKIPKLMSAPGDKQDTIIDPWKMVNGRKYMDRLRRKEECIDEWKFKQMEKTSVDFRKLETKFINQHSQLSEETRKKLSRIRGHAAEKKEERKSTLHKISTENCLKNELKFTQLRKVTNDFKELERKLVKQQNEALEEPRKKVGTIRSKADEKKERERQSTMDKISTELRSPTSTRIFDYIYCQTEPELS